MDARLLAEMKSILDFKNGHLILCRDAPLSGVEVSIELWA